VGFVRARELLRRLDPPEDGADDGFTSNQRNAAPRRVGLLHCRID
jgi:hypothetical protein